MKEEFILRAQSKACTHFLWVEVLVYDGLDDAVHVVVEEVRACLAHPGN